MTLVLEFTTMVWYCKWYHWLFLLFPLQALAIDGIAIEPLLVTIKRGEIGYFYIYNETQYDYILNARVIEADFLEKKEFSRKNNIPFTISPPLHLIKSRESIGFSIIPLSTKQEKSDGINEYLIMVKVIPKITSIEHFSVIPIIINLLVRLTIE